MSKSDLYQSLVPQMEAVFEGEHDIIANAANFSALIYNSLPGINWVGFYFLKRGDLVVGPFQGKPACIRIQVGRGVCGTAARELATVLVNDVSKFPGHIACDPDSKSEIVVPLVYAGKLFGVLDIDSPALNRFDNEDAFGLQRLVEVFLASCEEELQHWSSIEAGALQAPFI